jgi:hypothetical protein
MQFSATHSSCRQVWTWDSSCEIIKLIKTGPLNSGIQWSGTVYSVGRPHPVISIMYSLSNNTNTLCYNGLTECFVIIIIYILLHCWTSWVCVTSYCGHSMPLFSLLYLYWGCVCAAIWHKVHAMSRIWAYVCQFKCHSYVSYPYWLYKCNIFLRYVTVNKVAFKMEVNVYERRVLYQLLELVCSQCAKRRGKQ